METGNPGESSDGGSSVEIKIKTLDAQTYTMRVDRDMPIPALKEQLAALVGVAVPSQRLICRGKVLKDDQLLSSYNVEDGHTLHLVASPLQQPTATAGASGGTEDGGGMSDGPTVSQQNRGGHVSHSVLMGTINIPDGGEGAMPDLNRIISAVLSTVGLGHGVPGGLGANTAGVTAGLLPARAQQPAASPGQPRIDGLSAAGAATDFLEHPLHTDLELQIDALFSPSAIGSLSGASGPSRSTFTHPMVIPDALTTMSQYLDRLEQGFASNEAMTTGGNPPQLQHPVENPPTSGSYPVPGPPSLAVHSAQPSTSSSVPPSGHVQEHSSTPGPQTLSRRLPTPAALGALVRRVQGLLSGGAGTALSRLAGQLENEPSMNDVGARAEVQAAALRDGNMIQQLGALLLELGRTTQSLRMGQSPAESGVNAGPAVFISPTGPNPMMIQPPLAFPTGGSLGAVPIGTAQPNGGVFVPSQGGSLGPRSIDIHIHTSDFGLPPASPSSSPSPSSQQQPASRSSAGTTSGAPSLTMRHMRQFFERVDPASGGQSANAEPVGFRAPGTEEALSMGQLIDSAMAEQRTDPAAQASTGGGAGHYQGAFLTFDDSRSVRLLPARGRQNNTSTAQPTAASGSTHPSVRVAPESTVLMHHPTSSRLRDPNSQLPVRPSPLGANTANVSGVAPPPDSTAAVQPEHLTAVSQPTYRAQIHVQGLSGQGLSHPDGISFSLGPSGSGEFRIQQSPTSRGQNLQGSQHGASGSADIRIGTGIGVGQAASTANSVPVGVSSGRATSDADGGDRNPGAGTSSIGVTSIMGSVGPLLQQIMEAYQNNRAASRQQTDQVNQQEGRDNHQNSATVDVHDGGQAGHNESQQQNPHLASSYGVLSSEPPATAGTREGMDIDVDQTSDLNGGVSSLTSENPPGPSEAVPGAQGSQEVQIEDSGKDSTAEDGDHAPPVGLGLGVLQPLPSRPRRRSRRQPTVDGNAGRAVSQAGSMGQGGPNVLQNFMSQLDRSESRPEENASEHSMGQQLAGLLPLLCGRGGTQSGGSEIMAPLMSNPAISDLFRSVDGNAGVGLGGIMSQLMGNPLMGNIVRQVMAGIGDEVGMEEALPSRLDRESHGGLDLGAMLHQVIPVVSQMLGSGRNTDGTAHQVSGAGALSEAGIQGGESRSCQDPDGSKRWKDALTQEEVPSWTETLAADFNHQQSMPPQRPFSDVYARGSPVAKRQKTGLEGTAQKLEKGEPPEDILRSMAENAAALSSENAGPANELHTSELVQHVVSTEGLAEAYMAVLSHDLAARVAADPDFGDGSRFPNAVRVLKQSKAVKKPVGERQ